MPRSPPIMAISGSPATSPTTWPSLTRPRDPARCETPIAWRIEVAIFPVAGDGGRDPRVGVGLATGDDPAQVRAAIRLDDQMRLSPSRKSRPEPDHQGASVIRDALRAFLRKRHPRVHRG